MSSPSLANSNGIAFLVAAGVMLECIAAACSSPQTTELNAASRAPTLMKWVHIGLGVGGALILIGGLADREHAAAIFLGGAVAGGVFYGLYLHARSAGMASSEPGTEGPASSVVAYQWEYNRIPQSLYDIMAVS
jgi:hypothetical protein